MSVTPKTRCPADPKLTIEVPRELPEGHELEVVIRAIDTDTPPTGNARAVAAAMQRAASRVKHGRTREEIDADLAALRKEWERRSCGDRYA
jgi:hypothetical protein